MKEDKKTRFQDTPTEFRIRLRKTLSLYDQAGDFYHEDIEVKQQFISATHFAGKDVIDVVVRLDKFPADKKERIRQTKSDYELAKEKGLTSKKRWEDGIPHHPRSSELMSFLEDHDIHDYNDYFCWKVGGDGDNGESLMYEMDAFFEMKYPEETEETE